MKILHYVQNFSPYSQTFIYDQLLNLEEQGLDNYVMTQKRILEEERSFNKTLVQKRYLPEKIYTRIFPGYKHNLPNDRGFLNIIKKVDPDIIHAHFGNNGIFINDILEKNNINIPLVISFHGTDIISLPYFNNYYKQRLKKINECKNIYCTAHTEFLKNKLTESGISTTKIRIVPNTFDSNFCKKRKNVFYIKKEKLKIINTARFSEFKGQIYLLETFSKLIKDHPQTELTFAGDGKNKKNIEKTSKKLGIQENINFLGRIDHKKLPNILREHDVYVQPSIKDRKNYQTEGSPIAILEAIAAGLPVIVTNTGGMPETVMEDNQQFSFIVPKKDPQAIYEILKKMAGPEYQFQDNKKYAQKVLKKFSKENNINTILDIYKELSQNSNK